MVDPSEFNKILSAIKRVFSRSHHRRAVLNKALGGKKGPRGGKMYKCKMCKDQFAVTQVQVDHIEPVVPINKPALSMSWDSIVERLYCDPRNLQVLCRSCHQKKNKIEAAARAAARKLAKESTH